MYSHISLPFDPARAQRRIVLAPEIVLVPHAHRAVLFRSIYFLYDLHFAAGPARLWSHRAGESAVGWGAVVGAGFNGFSTSFLSASLDHRFAVGGGLVQHAFVLSLGFWPEARRWDE